MYVALAAVITAGVALAGYIVTYFNNVRLAQREARLDRVNRQLGELYGPLLAIGSASREAWLRRKHARGIPHPSVDRAGTESVHERRLPEDSFDEWRRWVTTVFLPGNQRLAELIISKADLLMDEEIPPCLTALCAHVAGWEVVMRRWEAGDFSITNSVIDYPDEVNDYARDAFAALKQTQAALLGSARAR